VSIDGVSYDIAEDLFDSAEDLALSACGGAGLGTNAGCLAHLTRSFAADLNTFAQGFQDRGVAAAAAGTTPGNGGGEDHGSGSSGGVGLAAPFTGPGACPSAVMRRERRCLDPTEVTQAAAAAAWARPLGRAGARVGGSLAPTTGRCEVLGAPLDEGGSIDATACVASNVYLKDGEW
jgi:hypothetical protein